MAWTDVIYLVKRTHDTDADDDLVIDETERMVYANKKSVRQTEFYQAAAADMRPEVMYEIHAVEYDKESIFKDEEGNEYSVMRAYQKGGELLEIIGTGPGNRPGTRRGP
jgi:hypothetical protein